MRTRVKIVKTINYQVYSNIIKYLKTQPKAKVNYIQLVETLIRITLCKYIMRFEII